MLALDPPEPTEARTMTASSYPNDPGFQPYGLESGDGDSQYAPTPGYYGRTPAPSCGLGPCLTITPRTIWKFCHNSNRKLLDYFGYPNDMTEYQVRSFRQAASSKSRYHVIEICDSRSKLDSPDHSTTAFFHYVPYS